VKGGASGTRRREVTSPVAIGDEEGKVAKRNRKKNKLRRGKQERVKEDPDSQAQRG
jgi:hypothetical protein